MGLFGLKTYIFSQVTDNLILNPWGSITLENHTYMYVWVSKVTPKTRVILDMV